MRRFAIAAVALLAACTSSPSTETSTTALTVVPLQPAPADTSRTLDVSIQMQTGFGVTDLVTSGSAIAGGRLRLQVDGFETAPELRVLSPGGAVLSEAPPDPVFIDLAELDFAFAEATDFVIEATATDGVGFQLNLLATSGVDVVVVGDANLRAPAGTTFDYRPSGDVLEVISLSGGTGEVGVEGPDGSRVPIPLESAVERTRRVFIDAGTVRITFDARPGSTPGVNLTSIESGFAALTEVSEACSTLGMVAGGHEAVGQAFAGITAVLSEPATGEAADEEWLGRLKEAATDAHPVFLSMFGTYDAAYVALPSLLAADLIAVRKGLFAAWEGWSSAIAEAATPRDFYESIGESQSRRQMRLNNESQESLELLDDFTTQRCGFTLQTVAAAAA